MKKEEAIKKLCKMMGSLAEATYYRYGYSDCFCLEHDRARTSPSHTQVSEALLNFVRKSLVDSISIVNRDDFYKEKARIEDEIRSLQKKLEEHNENYPGEPVKLD